MAVEIEFSIMSTSGEQIQPLLDRFTAETGIRVLLRLMTWDSAWGMFVRSALYGSGPDVSEVGTTWVSDLVGMNALRPFETSEVTALGRPAAFLPLAWRTATPRFNAPGPANTASGDRSADRVWAIPWLTGARLIHYKPSLLARAGVNPQTAFASPEAFGQAVEALAESGVRVPWTVPTGYTHTTLLSSSSWVWAADGDFVSPDGRAVAFTRPEALHGLAAYFNLGRRLAPEIRELNGLEPDGYFLSHEDTAMTISGPWLFLQARQRGVEVAAALPPGPSFVGGSNLCVWKHTRSPEAALRLVRFLTQTAAQVQYSQAVGLLPARLEALQAEPFASDPLWGVAVRGLHTGRIFPTIRLWGLLEDRLTGAFRAIWNDVLAGLAPEQALPAHLEPLAERLNPLLAKE